jgi:pimeloyl-ACP methyl ester carboxylesterase
VKLRLYHHHDGTRIAYREAGVGQPLALVHSAGLSHREFEPVVEELQDRYRLVLPDLPLHGDSEDDPDHPYTPEWMAEVLAGFLRDTCGAHPLVAGHEHGALLLLRATLRGDLTPGKLILLSSSLHRRSERGGIELAARSAARAASVPGMGKLVAHAARLAFRPQAGPKLSARGNRAAEDLVRHATADLGGNADRARAWARAVRQWPREQPELLDAYARLTVPTLLLWADEDPAHPLEIAEEALRRLPDAQLRVLPGTGFLMAYDDPVGLARELTWFCG